MHALPAHGDRPSITLSPLNVPDATGTAASQTLMLILTAILPGSLSGAESKDCVSTLMLIKVITILSAHGSSLEMRHLCSETSAQSKSHHLCGLQLLHL